MLASPACGRVNPSRDREVRGSVRIGVTSMTYLITFACYGCHLHGEETGSVDPAHNGWTKPETMGPPWQHAMAVEAAAYLGGHAVRRVRAG